MLQVTLVGVRRSEQEELIIVFYLFLKTLCNKWEYMLQEYDAVKKIYLT